jgi:hypothetical protein
MLAIHVKRWFSGGYNWVDSYVRKLRFWISYCEQSKKRKLFHEEEKEMDLLKLHMAFSGLWNKARCSQTGLFASDSRPLVGCLLSAGQRVGIIPSFFRFFSPNKNPEGFRSQKSDQIASAYHPFSSFTMVCPFLFDNQLGTWFTCKQKMAWSLHWDVMLPSNCWYYAEKFSCWITIHAKS